jgi:hypothetical protein
MIRLSLDFIESLSNAFNYCKKVKKSKLKNELFFLYDVIVIGNHLVMASNSYSAYTAHPKINIQEDIFYKLSLEQTKQIVKIGSCDLSILPSDKENTAIFVLDNYNPKIGKISMEVEIFSENQINSIKAFLKGYDMTGGVELNIPKQILSAKKKFLHFLPDKIEAIDDSTDKEPVTIEANICNDKDINCKVDISLLSTIDNPNKINYIKDKNMYYKKYMLPYKQQYLVCGYVG